MGQINIPMSNKNGVSSFWKSMWDSKHEFTQNIHDCFGLSMLVKAALNKFFIFQPQFSQGLRKFLFEENNQLGHVFATAVETIPTFQKEDFLNEQFLVGSQACRTGVINYALKVIPFFSTTSWIIKYKNWIIVFINLYLPKAKKSRFDYALKRNDDFSKKKRFDYRSNYKKKKKLKITKYKFKKKFCAKKFFFIG